MEGERPMPIDPTSRREIEGLNRLLKERERDHARESDLLRDNYEDKVDDLKADQHDALAELKRKSEAQTEAARRNFDESLNKNTDKFERSLTQERKDGYDRLGRATREQQRQLDQDREAMRRQISDYTTGTKRTGELEREQQELAARKMHANFENDRHEMKRYLDDKLSEQKAANSKALADTTRAARDSTDRNTRYLTDLADRDKLGAEIKYRKLVDDSESERDQLSKAFKNREQQLVDEKNRLAAQAGSDGEANIKDYRDRTENAMDRIVADNHFLNARREREHANQLATAEQEHQRKVQDMRAQFNQAETVTKARAEQEKDRSNAATSVNERRRKQEEFLRNEAIRKTAALAQDNLKDSYAENLHEIESKHQKQLLEQTGELKKQGAVQTMQTLAERAALKQEAAQQVNESHLHHAHEKQALIKSYQDRQDAMDDLRKRQLEDQKQSLGAEVAKTKLDSQRDIAKSSLENQTRLYMMRQELENRTRELEAGKSQSLDYATKNYEDRVKRVTANYHRALVTQQQGFEETTAAARHETMMQMAKAVGDAEHERRLQQLDLQNKNRALMTAFESRLNNVKDEHAAELEKARMENEKAMRDVLRKTKDTLEQERSRHSREMDMKELQMKERMRLQEEQFKAEIEKLKRTNELALKKS